MEAQEAAPTWSHSQSVESLDYNPNLSAFKWYVLYLVSFSRFEFFEISSKIIPT